MMTMQQELEQFRFKKVSEELKTQIHDIVKKYYSDEFQIIIWENGRVEAIFENNHVDLISLW